ncbi:neurogenic locus notch homolog protein 1-like [Ostrea edulis]|uniref:neurogenic locus notch homolog protein 1-like n=1 Tax=Ostrea edulis TaxID=37623 RepID=UPI0024AF3A0D|nr:neurogenic locus notch homolog protein 1-like [Ostrea edulis]
MIRLRGWWCLLCLFTVSEVNARITVYLHVNSAKLDNSTLFYDDCCKEGESPCNKCGLNVQLCIRQERGTCENSTTAWINMKGLDDIVIGKDIGDKENPLSMEVDKVISPSTYLQVTVYNNDSTTLYLNHTVKQQWTMGSQYLLGENTYETFSVNSGNHIQVGLTSWYVCTEGYHGAECSVYCQGNPRKCVVNGTTYCRNGWRGKDCDENIDECAEDVCANGAGVCTDTGGGFVCDCGQHMYGKQCVMDNDECLDFPCNAGTCINTIGGYKCICLQGTTGQNCELLASSTCTQSTCKNHGACSVFHDLARCSCEPYFHGPDCSLHCTKYCLNGGSCINDGIYPRCICSPGFKGDHCEIQDLCFKHICDNNAICSQNGTSLYCECKKHTDGDKCQYYDRCYDRPCQHGGQCSYKGREEYQCNCTGNWTGKNCENFDCDEVSPCLHGGTCRQTSLQSGFNCTCRPGYYGTYCEQVDACYNNGHKNPCLHGSMCIRQGSDFECQCVPGFMGKTCEHIDHCFRSHAPCFHGGTCVSSKHHHGDYTCKCTSAWMGDQCEDDVDECLYYPCGVQGTCNNTVGGFKCQCSPSWTGEHCETLIDSCKDMPCKNNGSCSEFGNLYLCTCSPQWKGSHCETDVDECSDSPCKNNATCKNTIGGYKCECKPGFNGTYCDEDIDECANDIDPCGNTSLCINTLGSYQCHYNCSSVKCYHNKQCHLNGALPSCQCSNNGDDMKWTGPVCDDRDYCAEKKCGKNSDCNNLIDGYICHYDPCSSSPCSNNGTCHKYHNHFTCKCDPEWTGVNCSIINHCFNNSCHHGQCVNKMYVELGYECKCEPGWKGAFCNETDHCFPEPCNQHGKCISLNNTYECRCDSNWTGINCANENYCELERLILGESPCQNDGDCSNNIDNSNYTCNCTEDFYGVHCEFSNYCTQQPCKNGATCRNDEISGYTCECTIGFNGTNCSTEIDYCLNSPCQHNGTCSSRRYGYYCHCVSGYIGRECQDDLDECKLDYCPPASTCYNTIGGFKCAWESQSGRTRRSKKEFRQNLILSDKVRSLPLSSLLKYIRFLVQSTACGTTGRFQPLDIIVDSIGIEFDYIVSCPQTAISRNLWSMNEDTRSLMRDVCPDNVCVTLVDSIIV